MSLFCEENIRDVLDDLEKHDGLRARIDRLKQKFRDHQNNFHESGVKHATFADMIEIAEKVRAIENKLGN